MYKTHTALPMIRPYSQTQNASAHAHKHMTGHIPFNTLTNIKTKYRTHTRAIFMNTYRNVGTDIHIVTQLRASMQN